MKDAGIEAKRDISAAGTLPFTLGPYAEAVEATLTEAERQNVIKRIVEKDASLWKNEPDQQKIIKNSLGWVTVASLMLEAVDDLNTFAAEIRSAFRYVMVCGMGGSSLFPEVLRQTFARQPGFPELLVLDSTDPDVIADFAKQINLSDCLFIIASKSGTTTEPIAFHRFWFDQVSRVSDSPGNSFIAITDPGTLMANTAASEGFRKVFLNPSDIGGRYSALSFFGMVPASLMGLDVSQMLARAQAMSQWCTSSSIDNPALLLGTVVAECAIGGRDKLTIVTDKELDAVGLWIEQLVAESTGKEGKGVVPIVGEPLGDVSLYGADRLFVCISVDGVDDDTATKLAALEAAGHPVVYRKLDDLYDLAAEFYVWEMATAVAGWRLGINPFDQPNVQESKDATKKLLDQYVANGTLTEASATATEGGLTVYAGHQNSDSVSVEDVIRRHVDSINSTDYFALLVYLEETADIDAALQDFRLSVRNRHHCATTLGYGPRFLHSTGQLHKGGADNGVFIQLTAPDSVDFPVPGPPYTFSILKQAQAQGDLESLLAHGRRAIRIDLGRNVTESLRRLKEIIDQQ